MCQWLAKRFSSVLFAVGSKANGEFAGLSIPFSWGRTNPSVALSQWTNMLWLEHCNSGFWRRATNNTTSARMYMLFRCEIPRWTVPKNTMILPHLRDVSGVPEVLEASLRTPKSYKTRHTTRNRAQWKGDSESEIDRWTDIRVTVRPGWWAWEWVAARGWVWHESVNFKLNLNFGLVSDWESLPKKDYDVWLYYPQLFGNSIPDHNATWISPSAPAAVTQTGWKCNQRRRRLTVTAWPGPWPGQLPEPAIGIHCQRLAWPGRRRTWKVLRSGVTGKSNCTCRATYGITAALAWLSNRLWLRVWSGPSLRPVCQVANQRLWSWHSVSSPWLASMQLKTVPGISSRLQVKPCNSNGYICILGYLEALEDSRSDSRR